MYLFMSIRSNRYPPALLFYYAGFIEWRLVGYSLNMFSNPSPFIYYFSDKCSFEMPNNMPKQGASTVETNLSTVKNFSRSWTAMSNNNEWAAGCLWKKIDCFGIAQVWVLRRRAMG